MNEFSDRYPKLSSYLLYYTDHPDWDLAGSDDPAPEDFDALAQIRLDEYIESCPETSHARALSEWRRFTSDHNPAWAEAGSHLYDWPVDPRDQGNAEPDRRRVERIVKLLEDRLERSR